MIELYKLLRIVVILLAVVLVIQVQSEETPSWAAPGQDIERQTVPTRTPTPGPTTATPNPTKATPKPGTPRPVTATPGPGTPAPTSSPDEPTSSPGGNQTSPTPDTTLTAVGTDASGTEDSAAPLTLPQTGGPNLLMWIEALALVIGALLLLTGSRVDRNRR